MAIAAIVPEKKIGDPVSTLPYGDRRLSREMANVPAANFSLLRIANVIESVHDRGFTRTGMAGRVRVCPGLDGMSLRTGLPFIGKSDF